MVRDFLGDRYNLEPISAENLLERIKDGLVTVLDVRPAGEFQAGHLPGAINIPYEQLERELAKHGLGAEHIVPNVNFFMYVPVDAEGNAEIRESRSKPGDFVDLRAEMDLLAVLSTCPEALNDATGAAGPTPIRVIVYRPA